MASPHPSGIATSTTPITHPCNTCQVAYKTPELQKGHMKSDWHRYNLKRRITSLPPITSDVFTEKVLQARAMSTAEANKATFERACSVCQRTYYSENSYRTHLSSQKHKSNEAASKQKSAADGAEDLSSAMSSTFSLGDPLPEENAKMDSDVEEEFSRVMEGFQTTNLNERPSPVKRPSNPALDSKANMNKGSGPSAPGSTTAGATEPASSGSAVEPAWTLKSCLFCSYASPTIPLNAHHMERFHSMYIPEKNYLVDLDGLLTHLGNRVHSDHQCLFCAKFKTSAFAVQAHMRDKGHCKIPYTTEDEQLDIGDFYDFRSTYSDGGDDSSDDGHPIQDKSMRDVRPGGGEGHGHGHGQGGEEDGWETDSSASSLDSADLTAVPATGHLQQFNRLDKNKHHSQDDPRHHHQPDGWHSHAHGHHAVFYDEYELYLPSGKTVGHRSLNKYYRQNLHSYPWPEERAERLALEAAAREDGDGSDAMDVDGEKPQDHQSSRGGQSREVAPRGTAGMLGVTAQQKKEVERLEQRDRSLENFVIKKKDWVCSNAQNNHKRYYYRFAGGG